MRRLEYWRNWPRRRSRDCSRLSCGVANMQLQQGFRQTVPVRSFARDDELAVQYAWLFVIELRNAQRKQSGFAVVFLRSTSPLNRACMVVTDTEPERLAPLPRQRQ